MNEPFAIFLTVFGLGGIPIAIGFILATRGAAPRPWLGPWRAGYGVTALGFLLVPLVTEEPARGVVVPIGHLLFLLGAGLHALGWLRLWRASLPLALAALPAGLYGLLFLFWARPGSLPRWVGLFSILYTLSMVAAATATHRGLRAGRSPQGLPAVLLLSLHALFWLIRTLHTFEGFPGMGFLVSMSAVMVEGTLFLGFQAYLQWCVVMD